MSKKNCCSLFPFLRSLFSQTTVFKRISYCAISFCPLGFCGHRTGQNHFKTHLNLPYLILNFGVLKHLFERVHLPMVFCCLSTKNHLSFCLRMYTTLGFSLRSWVNIIFGRCAVSTISIRFCFWELFNGFHYFSQKSVTRVIDCLCVYKLGNSSKNCFKSIAICIIPPNLCRLNQIRSAFPSSFCVFFSSLKCYVQQNQIVYSIRKCDKNLIAPMLWSFSTHIWHSLTQYERFLCSAVLITFECETMLCLVKF